jgi:hypothetical protein
MNKTKSHLYMSVSHHQQCFSRRMYSSNQIFNVYFLLNSFPSFDWTSVQELEITPWPYRSSFFFNPSDSVHLPSPPPAVPCQTRDLHHSPPTLSLLSSSIWSHQWRRFASHYHHWWCPSSLFPAPLKSPLPLSLHHTSRVPPSPCSRKPSSLLFLLKPPPPTSPSQHRPLSGYPSNGFLTSPPYSWTLWKSTNDV